MKQPQGSSRSPRALIAKPPRAVVAQPGAGHAVESEPASGRDERVRRAAYAIWEAGGRTEGHELDDWLQAEAEVARSGPSDH